jgi:hypothetical protein
MRIEMIALKPGADTLFQPFFYRRFLSGSNVDGKAKTCQVRKSLKNRRLQLCEQRILLS